jgi:BASS family bile acid:Na+ symporter
MHTSLLSTVATFVLLMIIMLGLGLSLTTTDFRRAASARRAVITALACQILVMPAIGVLLLFVVHAGPTLAIGLLLLAASPGGTLAAVYSYLAGGDVALNITLTAINSVLSVLTLPLVVWAATSAYSDTGIYIGLHASALGQLVGGTLGPVVLGMLIRKFWPRLADALRVPLRYLSLTALIVVVAGTMAQNWDRMGHALVSIVPVTTAFCVAGLLIGYWLPRLLKLERPQAISTTTEIGIHNSALAITVAISPTMLNAPEVALTPAMYALISFVATGIAAFILTRLAARASSVNVGAVTGMSS